MRAWGERVGRASTGEEVGGAVSGKRRSADGTTGVQDGDRASGDTLNGDACGQDFQLDGRAVAGCTILQAIHDEGGGAIFRRDVHGDCGRFARSVRGVASVVGANVVLPAGEIRDAARVTSSGGKRKNLRGVTVGIGFDRNRTSWRTCS